MNCLRRTLPCLLAFCVAAAMNAQPNESGTLKVSSPNGQITFLLFDGTVAPEASSQAGAPGLRYAVEFHGKRLLGESALGMDIVGQPALGPGMRCTGEPIQSVDKNYTIPVGKTRAVRNHYNGLRANC